MSKKNRDRQRVVREMQAQQRARERRKRNLIVGAVVAVVIVAIVGIGIAVQSSRNDTGAGSATPAGVTDSYGIARGKDSAPVTVTLYEDFQCPVCKQAEEWLGETITSAVDAGTVQVVYRPIAFLDDASTTDYSSRALNSAACVLDDSGVDTFVAYHELLFQQQPAEGGAGLSDDELADLAEQAGADRDAVAACQSDETFSGWTRAATEAASKDKVAGTPTMRIDDQDVPILSGGTQEAAIQAFNDAVAAAQEN